VATCHPLHGTNQSEDDAAFIAAAHNDLPAVRGEIDRLRAELQEQIDAEKGIRGILREKLDALAIANKEIAALRARLEKAEADLRDMAEATDSCEVCCFCRYGTKDGECGFDGETGTGCFVWRGARAQAEAAQSPDMRPIPDLPNGEYADDGRNHYGAAQEGGEGVEADG
jgi:hypothetical protein